MTRSCKPSDLLNEHHFLDLEKDVWNMPIPLENEDVWLNQIADSRKGQKRISVTLDDL